MKFSEIVVFASTVCMAGAALSGAVPYANDFARRTSGPVQTGRWLEQHYQTGSFAANYMPLSGVPGEQLPYDNSAEVQDNWVKITQSGALANVIPAIADNSANQAAGQPGANQYARFGNSVGIVPATAVMQSFYNSFSNGVLRIYADLRAPTNWPKGNGYLRVQPLYREARATIIWASGSKAIRTFANWGIQRPAAGEAGSGAKLIALAADGKGGSQFLSDNGGRGHVNRHWYRFVMDLDLDAGKYTGTVYDQGLDHPELDGPNGAKVFDFPQLTANWSLKNAECGPVEGIALRVSDVQTASPVDRYVEPCFDNLVCEWKAPGATDFVRFYENDFTTRRVRTIEPAGTAEHVYVRDRKSTWMAWQPYANVIATTTTNLWTQIVPAMTDGGAGRQPRGLNGWRRANTGGGTVGIVRYPTGNAVLRVSDRDSYAVLTQTLGESVTSGKVRYSCDFRLPNKWWWSYHGVYATLGDAGMWGAKNAGYTDHIGGRLGAASAGLDDVNAFHPHFNTATGAGHDAGVSFKSNTWYRAIQVVDLDTRTTTGRIYELGANPVSWSFEPAASSLVYEKESELHSTVSEISAFGLAAYGAGRSQTSGVEHREHVYFDNVQVWKDWDEAQGTGTLILRDEFESFARCYPEQMRGRLLGTFHNDDGQDHWIRRNNGDGETWITSGENPCVAACGASTHSYAVQALGSCFRQRKVVAQADIRPPGQWTWSNARAALVIVGGDGFLNGNRGDYPDGVFTRHAYGIFGFGNNASQSDGYYKGTKLRVLDGDRNGGGTVLYSASNVDASHWYRFKATFDLEANTYDVEVFDQGAAHPASTATPNGAPYASWKGLKCRKPAEDVGVTSICLNTYGNPPVLPGDPEDEGLALYDNILVASPSGTLVLVR